MAHIALRTSSVYDLTFSGGVLKFNPMKILRISNKTMLVISKLVLIYILSFHLNAQDVSSGSTLEVIPFNGIASAFKGIPSRNGTAPDHADGIPHQQYSQNAPVSIQNALKDAASELPGITFVSTPYSLAGSIGWRLKESFAGGLGGAFIRDSLEFAHQHRPSDGSMHMLLPNMVAKSALDKGWGVMHPWSDTLSGSRTEYVMIFGPRDEYELKTIWILSQISYYYARGMEVDLES